MGYRLSLSPLQEGEDDRPARSLKNQEVKKYDGVAGVKTANQRVPYACLRHR